MALKANYMQIALSIVYISSVSLEHEMCFSDSLLDLPIQVYSRDESQV